MALEWNGKYSTEQVNKTPPVDLFFLFTTQIAQLQIAVWAEQYTIRANDVFRVFTPHLAPVELSREHSPCTILYR